MVLPPGCQYIPGTATKVGAGCLARSAYPWPSSVIDPVVNGADPTGASDSTVAFRNTLTAGNMYIKTPGTYRIDVDGGGTDSVTIPANRTIICAPGVVLKTNLHDTHTSGIFTIEGTSKTNITIAGCTFQGGNINPVLGAKVLDSNQSNYLIDCVDGSGLLIEGNTFVNSFGNAAVKFETGSTTPGCSSSTVQWNTFYNNPYYGLSISSGTGDKVNNNLFIDSDCCVEDDSCATETIGTITVQNNILISQFGDCRFATPSNAGCDITLFMTGGNTPATCVGYATNTVKNNYLLGGSNQKASIENNGENAGSIPTYTNNIMGNTRATCLNGAVNC